MRKCWTVFFIFLMSNYSICQKKYSESGSWEIGKDKVLNRQNIRHEKGKINSYSYKFYPDKNFIVFFKEGIKRDGWCVGPASLIGGSDGWVIIPIFQGWYIILDEHGRSKSIVETDKAFQKGPGAIKINDSITERPPYSAEKTDRILSLSRKEKFINVFMNSIKTGEPYPTKGLDLSLNALPFLLGNYGVEFKTFSVDEINREKQLEIALESSRWEEEQYQNSINKHNLRSIYNLFNSVETFENDFPKWKNGISFKLKENYFPDFKNIKDEVIEMVLIEDWLMEANASGGLFTLSKSNSVKFKCYKESLLGNKLQLDDLKEIAAHEEFQKWYFNILIDPMTDIVSYYIQAVNSAAPLLLIFDNNLKCTDIIVGLGKSLPSSDTELRIDKNSLIFVNHIPKGEQEYILKEILKGKVALTRYKNQTGSPVLTQLDLEGFKIAYQYMRWRFEIGLGKYHSD